MRPRLVTLGEAIGAVDRALLALRDRLTPWQRWTTATLASVSLAVLLFGAPGVTVVVPAAPAAAAPAPVAAPDRTAPAPADRPAFEVALDPPVVAVPGPEVEVGTGAPAAFELPVRVTALLPAARPDALPGRSEADIAEVFLGREGLAVDARAPVDDRAACEAVGGERTLVLAPATVPDDLRSCLLGSGATLVAFHDDGSTESVVSTRLARHVALGRLGRWAAATDGVLDGRVGLVGSAGDEPWLAAAVPALRRAGLDVVRTAFVTDTEVGSGVRDFVAAGVDGVVLAAPHRVRQQWAAQHAVLDPGTQFVVADAHDGVASEAYAPTFDGALAHTSLRGAWYGRAHGETPEQQRCRETWEASVAPSPMLAGEAPSVYAWCQHVELAAAVVTGGIEPTEVTERLRLPSPLTSDLGPLPDGGWGPRASAVVVWRAGCACWEERTPFRAP